MTTDRLVNLLVTVTLVEMMVAVGLGVSLRELFDVLRDARLLARAVLANYVLFPAVTVGLLYLFAPHPLVTVGFLVLAVCPGAPFSPMLTAIARGNTAVAVGSMAVLAASSAVLAPVLLGLLVPLLAEGDVPAVSPAKLVLTLLLTQLLPLAVGIAVRQFLPGVADRVRRPADLVSKVLNIAAIMTILATQYPLLAELRLRGLFGMSCLLVSSWVVGWFLGGRAIPDRRAMTLTTALRNVGVGLVIVTGSFAGTPAVTAVTIYGLLEIFGTLGLALLWSRSPLPARSPIQTEDN